MFIRENFGPHFKHKYDINSNTWNYNHPIGGHQDHIHISVRKIKHWHNEQFFFQYSRFNSY